MLSRRRLPILVAFPALYVGVAAARAGDARPSAWLLILLAVVVALAGGRFHDGIDRGAARRRVWAAAGVSVTIATAALSTRPAWAALARELGALVAMLAAIRAVSTIEGDVGLGPSATEASAVDGVGPRALTRAATGTVVVAWGLAITSDAMALFGVARGLSPVVVATAAGIVSTAALGMTALLVAGARRLELSAPPRALACAGAVGVSALAAGGLALGRSVSADAAFATFGALGSAVVVRLAHAQAPLALARVGRRAATLFVFGGPIAALAAVASGARTASGEATAFAIAAIALLVGALSRRLEEPFVPAKGALLDALADARSAARDRDMREAISYALMRLREACSASAGPTATPSPELWLFSPTRVITVDPAGYLQERHAELPPSIIEVAFGEPYATVRASVLRALEVRRADLRPMLSWLDQRDAFFATLIADSDAPDGLLIVPVGTRTSELTIEEARAAKQLADAFVAVAQASSARERHLDREQGLQRRIDQLEDEIATLRHAIELDVGRNALASTRLARPATVGIYSAASRLAYDALERRMLQHAPILVVARAGIDPVPYVARAHLSGPRKEAPLVVVDGTSTREHDVDRWMDPRESPLALADRGLLFLVDGPALPLDIQALVARAIAHRRAPWERAAPIDVAVALGTTSASLDDLVDAGRLAPELAARLDGIEPIVLPGLRDRPDDLHSIVADRLAREGLRVHGRPIGIEAAAYARLVEHPFEGEDAELASIVTRLVARVRGEVVRVADVDAIGLAPTDEDEAAPWPEGARSANDDA